MPNLKLLKKYDNIMTGLSIGNHLKEYRYESRVKNVPSECRIDGFTNHCSHKFLNNFSVTVAFGFI